MSEASRKEKSGLIAEKLEKTGAWRRARTVMFYVTHGSEVRTEGMMERAWRSGKNVVVPFVEDEEKPSISCARIRSIDGDLRKGSYGIREPVPGRCEVFQKDRIDLVIVPAVAFDRSGHRIGYGKGCYDRWLRNIPLQKRIGLAYDMQIVDRLPVESTDVPVGMIVSEKRVLEINRKRKGDNK